MGFLITAGKILLFAFAIANIAFVLKTERNNLGFAKQVWMQFRFGMLIQCLLLLVLTVVVGVSLIVYVPGLEYGWLHLFVSSGGNALIAPVTDASSSDYLLLRLVPIAFCLAFLVAIPFLAKMEEEMFRKGHTEWKSIWWQSTKFGLVHCIVGIPIGFGIALIMSGLFYAYHYKRTFENNIDTLGYLMAEEKAVMVSTTYHSLYNSIIITLLLVISAIMV
jgi:hypothetical protein